MGEIIKYSLRRLIIAITVLFGSTVIAFTLGVIAPGDPAREVLSMNGSIDPTAEEIEALREKLGLNRPYHIQYKDWALNVLKGDLGISYITKEPVATELARRLPLTLQLAVWAVVIATVTGIPAGMLMGAKQNSWIDHSGRMIALIFISAPGFLIALLLIILFAEKLGLMPTSGFGSWQQMVLPALVLATGTSAILMRLSRAVMLEVMNEPYILTARAKGLRESYIIVHHALKNMLIPLVTVIGTYFGGILGGTVIVEVIFAIPGIGRYAVDGIFQRDYPVIQGYVLFTTFVFIVFNLLTDFLYLFIHPQIRLGGKQQ